MRTLLIFLSIALVYTLIQHINGSPINLYSSESEEDVNAETEIEPKVEPISENNDQSSEEKQIVVDPPVFTGKLEAPKSPSIEDDNDDGDDDPMSLADIVNNDHRRIFHDDDDDDDENEED